MSQSLAPAPRSGAPLPDTAWPPQGGEGGVVTFGQVGRALARRWRLIGTLVATALAGSFVFVNVVEPSYTAESKVLLESRDNFFTRPGMDRGDGTAQIDEQAVASQVQVAMSRDLAREAIKRLGLVGNPEFDPMRKGMGLAQRVLVLFGVTKNPLERPPEDRVLAAYYDKLVVYSVGKSRILSVEFRSRDADLAARGANTVAELYLDQQEAAKKEMARSASAWLGSSIEGLRTRVAEAEAKVEAFRARTGLLTGSGTATITAQQLSDINGQLAQARTAKADAEAKAGLIRDLIKSGRTFEIPDVANNELIRRLIEQRITQRTQLALELRTLLPEHPRIKELNAQLADLEAQIRGAAERTVRTLENDARIAGSRVETLQAALDEQKTLAAGANVNEVELRALEREAKAQREQLESYLARYREATARDAENATPADARIVSRAVAPSTPSFPKKLPTILLVTLATFVLTAGAIVARELLRAGPGPREAAPADGVGDAQAAVEPVTVLAETPLRGSVDPAPGEGDLQPAAGGAPGAFAFDALVARLRKSEPDGRGRRVLVTGTGEPVGTEAVALELGRTLASSARAILVAVDACGEGEGRLGFTDLVAGEASFLDVIEREPGTRLDRVFPGLLDGALIGEEWQGVEIALAALDQTYDWVLCALADAGDPAFGLLASRVDAVVICSAQDPSDERLVALYDAAKAAGASDIVVAQDGLRWALPQAA